MKQLQIRMFLGLPDPHPNPEFICMDPVPAPGPDPSMDKQNIKKNLDFFCFVAYLWLFFEDVNAL
jgi:hypothetical protein